MFIPESLAANTNGNKTIYFNLLIITKAFMSLFSKEKAVHTAIRISLTIVTQYSKSEEDKLSTRLRTIGSNSILIFAVLLPGAKKGRKRKNPKSLLNDSF